MSEDAAPPSNVPEFTVSELSGSLRRTVEESFSFVRVRGEISGFKRHSSGHLYFALKDAEAVLDAVCWRGAAQRLGLNPEDGMEVLATGRLTTYPGRSKYQMVVERIELAGQGALLKLLEDRKRRLMAEGLFEPSRKRPIPYLPDVIGVVTSPTGAVIRDILHRLADRFPRHVLLWPVAVQGEGAAAQVAAAIRGFNAIEQGGTVPRPDVLIVARGGGSLEDLMAFNEEEVVRAAAASDIPLISAVGHETDTTLIDFAADMRAPTPTASAEMAVPVRADLLATVAERHGRLAGAVLRALADRRDRVEQLFRALPHPRRVMEDGTRRLDEWGERLDKALPLLVERRRQDLERLSLGLAHGLKTARATGVGILEKDALRLEQAARRLADAMPRQLADRGLRLDSAGKLLESYSYRKVLERGYAVIRDGEGHPVTQVAAAKPGLGVTVEFSDGRVGAVVNGAPPAPSTPPVSKPKRATSASDGRQGSLL